MVVWQSHGFLCLFLPLAVVPYFLWKNRGTATPCCWCSLWSLCLGRTQVYRHDAGGHGGGLPGRAGHGGPVPSAGARKAVFAATVSLVVLNLLVFKYLNLLGQPHPGPGPRLEHPADRPAHRHQLLYTFQILSMLSTSTGARWHCSGTFLSAAVHQLFPSSLPVPSSRFSFIEEEILHRRESWADVRRG